MFIPLHERESKLPSRRAQRCRFLAYSYTALLVPTYLIISVNNGTYGTVQRFKDVVFDDSCAHDPEVDNPPSDEAFAELIKDITEHPADLTHLDPVSLLPTPDHVPPVPTIIEQFNPIEYQELSEYDVDPNHPPFPLILADSEEYEQKIDEFGISIYWNKITGDASPTPVHSIAKLNCHLSVSMFLMSVSTACPTSFKEASALSDWHPPILKEMDNFIDYNCFDWIKDIG